MNELYSILSAAILFGTAIPPARAAVQLSLDSFHDNLASYGDWREVGGHGYCWQPRMWTATGAHAVMAIGSMRMRVDLGFGRALFPIMSEIGTAASNTPNHHGRIVST